MPDANILADQLQPVLQRIATVARGQPDGLGPIEASGIFDAFRHVLGVPPDDAAEVLLLRLPGLGAVSGSDTGSRTFIDEDFADAARAGDVFAYCKSPYEDNAPELWKAVNPIGELAAAIVAVECQLQRIGQKQISTGLRTAIVNRHCGMVATDVFKVLCAANMAYEGPDVAIADTVVGDIELSETLPVLVGITFSNCALDRVYIDGSVSSAGCPRFVGCEIDALIGRVGRADLPAGVFDDTCSIRTFSSFDATTASIMKAKLPVGLKVALTILKKLFSEPGSGREEGALYRGLDQHARGMVGAVLSVISAEQLARPITMDRRVVWVPSRSEYRRVFAILGSPTQSRDPVVEQCAALHR